LISFSFDEVLQKEKLAMKSLLRTLQKVRWGMVVKKSMVLTICLAFLTGRKGRGLNRVVPLKLISSSGLRPIVEG